MSAPDGPPHPQTGTSHEWRVVPSPGGTTVDVAVHPRPPWDRPDQRAAMPALYDELTLLPNRALLVDRLAMALSRTHRSGEPLAVVLCEIDDIDDLVARHGRAMVDGALQVIAKRLERSVRTSDSVARAHGDELVLLCERLTHTDDVTVVLDRVHESMREPIELPDGTYHLTLSLGAVITNDPMLELDELIDEAGDLVDAAREDGPGRSKMSDWSFQLFNQAAAALEHQRDA